MWADLENIASHVEWMEDAVSIRFRGSQRRGVGTEFDCITQVGPLRLTDLMQITEWRANHTMGVRHVGLVRGAGRFRLRRARGGRTRFSWEERLVFPWWLGGPVAGIVGAPILRRIWRRNLQNLASRFAGV